MTGSSNIFFFCSRSKRDAIIYQFQPEHIIILSIKEEVSNSSEDSAVKIFVLDPSSTSLLPNKALTSENLTYMILKIDDSDLPYPLISVNNQVKDSDSIEDGISKLTTFFILFGIFILPVLIFFCFCFCPRCECKRYFFLEHIFL